MIGIWTTKVGYHNLWEFWFFNAQFGFTMGAQFSYGQAFMAELVPRGREYMFFSLLGIVSKGSGKPAGANLMRPSQRPPPPSHPNPPIQSTSLTFYFYIAWIGPIVCSAIVDRNGNQWTAFPFVAALIFVPFVGIFFISEVKSRKECAEYLARESADLRKV
jgi:MFS-type transporter involved in bile tolerance (Atg22 family)